ncbi:histidinol-phosphate transaminase [Sporolactobacillus shoreicorticis]|uniref:Histidinol-phosphate aminotransferase n=1 Tax=Sporolactobacillus shoreicorticis TaxID=1923877 RepID=A0ABW5SAF9_9BACL|nr:histidinol-phosphate transaminase [Sporolactobacillus shoreicorticis]MCO7127277.1 histidinol-phosphate transaminase [Sporolactobacillus shoreicorticis]
MFKKNLEKLRAYDPGPSVDRIKKKYGLKRIVKLDSNENVYGASPNVRKAITQDALLPELYPDCQNTELRYELSRRLGVKEDRFLFGAGLDEMIVLISRAFLDSDSSMIMAWPTFYEYYCHAQIEGATTKKIPCDKNGKHDWQAMLEAIDETTKVIWICNPNNPTGTYLAKSELDQFIQAVPKHVLIVIDEAYIDFVTAKDFPNGLDYLATNENVLVLRTFSKSYGLASFRIGYAIGSLPVVEEIGKVRPPFNNPRLSQVAALAALKDNCFKDACVLKNNEVLSVITAFLDKKGISYYGTQANFIYIKVAEPKQVALYCKKKGFLINPFQDGVRVTIGKMDDMKCFLQILEQAIFETSAEPSK